jgi:UDP-N-acetyl-D-mannosaminuronic acid dehydrogenase
LGATVYGVDPVISDVAGFDLRRRSLADLPDLDLDGAVLVTDHEAFEDLDWASLPPLVVVDGRQALSLADTHHRVYTVGSGWEESESDDPGEPDDDV